MSTRWGIDDPIARRATWRLAGAASFLAAVLAFLPRPWPESWRTPAADVPPTTSMPWTP